MPYHAGDIKSLDGASNYRSWVGPARAHLQHLDQWSAVDPTMPVPSGALALRKWYLSDQKAFGELYSLCSDRMQQEITNWMLSPSGRLLWVTLELECDRHSSIIDPETFPAFPAQHFIPITNIRQPLATTKNLSSPDHPFCARRSPEIAEQTSREILAGGELKNTSSLSLSTHGGDNAIISQICIVQPHPLFRDDADALSQVCPLQLYLSYSKGAYVCASLVFIAIGYVDEYG